MDAVGADHQVVGPVEPSVKVTHTCRSCWASAVEAARISAALAAVRRRLGGAAYDRAWTAGAARTLEEAADDAIHLLDQGPGSA
jgi:hypothetical protein